MGSTRYANYSIGTSVFQCAVEVFKQTAKSEGRSNLLERPSLGQILARFKLLPRLDDSTGGPSRTHWADPH